MEIITRFHSFFLLGLVSGFVPPLLVASVGINYGQIANNLPSPQNVVPLLRSIGINKVKLYDADPRVLRAFANTSVEFVVALGNQYLAKMTDPEKARAWVKTNVQSFLPATNITCITVGNEVLTFNDTSLTENLLPAMQNVHTALVSLGLDKQVTVTTAHSLAVLENSYPPSAGSFRRDLTEYISPILNFHVKTGSPFLINAYPFFAYKGNPKQVSLDFVLFQPNPGVVDPGSNLRYDNMLFAQMDAVYAALASLGYKKLPVQISETGWPSKGDEDEVGATPENAKKYNGNLMKLVALKKGTPSRPSSDLNIYVFALFNENMKPGPTSERNYGLFKPDGTPAYELGLASTTGSGNSSSTGGTGGVGYAATPPSPTSSSTGYLSVSSTAVAIKLDYFFLISCLVLTEPWVMSYYCGGYTSGEKLPFRAFLWRSCAGGLATAVNLQKRQINVDPICARCGKGVETADHILLDCEFARATWFGSRLSFSPLSNSPNLQSLIQSWTAWPNLDKEQKRHLESLAASTCWQLWKAQNDLFNGCVASPMEINMRAEISFAEFGQAQRRTKATITGGLLSTTTSLVPPWCPPTAGTFLLNTDAALKEGSGGLGFVFRDHKCGLLFSDSQPECFSSVLLGESLAIRGGLLPCIADGFDCIKVESDSSEAVKFINSTTLPPIEFQPIIEDIKFLKVQFTSCSFFHISREINSVADSLARKAVSLAGRMD
ncbi:glucan endo-1,3-beta-glucosidase 11-like [Telopea speciosissima]|uniref:glucan endo-1,3-beta-glucosidase 11-like n=1 Tax=Telopea speciosissima TaxID=54955 RepID=UPI001CC62F63|nr:glucan endo-1,3-beta-glucosidase 11-like [Telopea speciosissima]